jgi:hypothetical protein
VPSLRRLRSNVGCSRRLHRGRSPKEFRRLRQAPSSQLSAAPAVPRASHRVQFHHNSPLENRPSPPRHCSHQLHHPDRRQRRRNAPSCRPRR